MDNFQNIIRFDQTDILSNTSEFEYDIIQRIYGRRRSTRHEARLRGVPRRTRRREAKSFPSYIPGVSVVRPHCEDESKTTRELLSWEVKQKYYINRELRRRAGAGPPQRIHLYRRPDRHRLPGRAANLESGDQQTAHRDLGQYRRAVAAGLRSGSRPHQLQRNLCRISLLGNYFVGGSHASFTCRPNSVTETISNAPLVFNQFRVLVGYGHPNKRGFSGGFSMGYDQNLEFLQYAAGQSSYNWDCCGLSFEFRHIDVPGVNVENQYRFAFTLSTSEPLET